MAKGMIFLTALVTASAAGCMQLPESVLALGSPQGFEYCGEVKPVPEGMSLSASGGEDNGEPALDEETGDKEGSILKLQAFIVSTSQEADLRLLGPRTGLQVAYADAGKASDFITWIRKSGTGTVLSAPRLTGYMNQAMGISLLNQRAFLTRFVLKGGQSCQAADPVVVKVEEGLQLGARFREQGDGMTSVDISLRTCRLHKPVTRLQTFPLAGGAGQVAIPIAFIERIACYAPVLEGKVLVIRGLSGVEDGQVLIVLVHACPA